MSERQERAEKIITGHVTFGIISGYTRKKITNYSDEVGRTKGEGVQRNGQNKNGCCVGVPSAPHTPRTNVI